MTLGVWRLPERVATAEELAPSVAPDTQAIFRRRRHQPRRPLLAKIRPGSPAPARRTAVNFQARSSPQRPSSACVAATESIKSNQ